MTRAEFHALLDQYATACVMAHVYETEKIVLRDRINAAIAEAFPLASK